MFNTAILASLSPILTIAVYDDIRRHRISNTLSLIGLVVGLGFQLLTSGLHGVTIGLLGVATGLACFAPFYLLRSMGAGDVKLLAAVGAFLGPRGVFYAALLALIAGGLGAIGYVLCCALRASVKSFVHDGLSATGASAMVAAQIARRDRLPFALPIAIGSIAACWCLSNFVAGGAAYLGGALR